MNHIDDYFPQAGLDVAAMTQIIALGRYAGLVLANRVYGARAQGKIQIARFEFL